MFKIKSPSSESENQDSELKKVQMVMLKTQESQKVKFNEAKRPEQEGLVKLKKRKAGQA